MDRQTTSKKQLAPVYDHKKVEQKWYGAWVEAGVFRAERDPDREPFTIVIPPPNVTGSLHLGHALDNTLQDILIRWHRMMGDVTLWMPGMDHAGIATQVKVEQSLAQEGKTRYDVGRERFVELAWDWREQYGGEIMNQLKRLGASLDWSRERFTMDKAYARAVREVFVDYYERGLIYRGNYIINWCPRCSTALSDLEVEHEDTTGKLYYIQYPLADGSGYVEVATTRPETMLGDTALAVHPGDERYESLVGNEAVLPIIGRHLPIIEDRFVDPEFGTGMVKVTPAHDPNDFELGRRHDLEIVKVIDEDARMTAAAGPYEGLDRYECRDRIVEALRDKGLLRAIEEHEHSVGHCDRCDEVVEPLVSRQWFVRMKPLAGPALDAVNSGAVSFVPERFTRVFTNWMENIRDWCISRQIWWGHRIPAWYCEDCGETIVAKEDPTECTACGSKKLVQDPDVLDTWFSSALWPFATLGWPEDTKDLEYFFPTDILVTAYDIIFFWVARMIFSSMELMGEVPFHTVFIHGLIRAEDGRKMSKSLGNGVDPLDVIDEYGADTLRFSLVTGNTPGNDMRFRWEKVEGSQKFCNKLWNATRFVLMNLEGFDPSRGMPGHDRLEPSDRWILSRLQNAKSEVQRHLERFDLGEASRTLYQFTWSELCDWYIELVKPRLYDDDDEQARYAAQYVLWTTLEQTLRLLHPFMPFITEELWQHLPHTGDTIVTAPWPQPTMELVDEQAEDQMDLYMEAIRGIRNIRAELNLGPGQWAAAIIQVDDRDLYHQLIEGSDYIRDLARVDGLELRADTERKPRKALAAIARGMEIYVPLEGLVDIDAELERLGRELEEAQGFLKESRGRLANKNFLEKAPREVVERERTREQEQADRVLRLKQRISQLSG